MKYDIHGRWERKWRVKRVCQVRVVGVRWCASPAAAGSSVHGLSVSFSAVATSSTPPSKISVSQTHLLLSWFLYICSQVWFSFIFVFVVPIAVAEDERETKHLEVLDGADSRLRLFQIDLLDYDSIVTAVNGAVGVFHIASPCTIDQVHDPEVRSSTQRLLCIITKRAFWFCALLCNPTQYAFFAKCISILPPSTNLSSHLKTQCFVHNFLLSSNFLGIMHHYWKSIVQSI